MKPIIKVLMALTLCGSLVFTAGCGENNESDTAETEIGTVSIGDLALDVSAVGNLELSDKEVLTFEQAGTVKDVLAEEGDYVQEGQVLATLDTSEKDDYFADLEKAIETKDQALTQAELNYDTAQEELDDLSSDLYINRKKAEAEIAVINAEAAVETAETSFENAETKYLSNWTVPSYIRVYTKTKAELEIAEISLTEAEQALADLSETLEQEKTNKEKELDILESKLEEAQKDYDDAVETFEEAQLLSWELAAPFTGYITSVKITEGADVNTSSTAFELADPNEFKVDVLVSEVDISNISVGSTGTVQLDADQTVILPVTVTRISPTATINSGVVNYSVTVEIQSTQNMMSLGQSGNSTFRDSLANLEEGELPENLQRAVDQGMMTQEQAEELLDNMQSGDFGGGRGGFFSGGTQDGTVVVPDMGTGSFDERPPMPDGAVQVTPSQDGFGFSYSDSGSDTQVVVPSLTVAADGSFQLREGLTATVSIVTETRTSVLLVPTAAITTSGGVSYVTVIVDEETQESREIEIGLSDWQNTEVLSGLAEGEQILVPINTGSSSSSSSQSGIVFRSVGGGMR